MSEQYDDGIILKFTDGIAVNTGGPFRKMRRYDGLYVIGRGVLCPVNSEEDAEELIKLFSEMKGEK